MTNGYFRGLIMDRAKIFGWGVAAIFALLVHGGLWIGGAFDKPSEPAAVRMQQPLSPARQPASNSYEDRAEAAMTAWLAENLGDPNYQVIKWYTFFPGCIYAGVKVRYITPAGGPAVHFFGFLAVDGGGGFRHSNEVDEWMMNGIPKTEAEYRAQQRAREEAIRRLKEIDPGLVPSQ